MSTDLFGAELPQEDGSLKKRAKPKPRGYARPPGTGPKSETCRSCENAVRSPFHAAFWKCKLIKPTRGAGTDIRLKSPACSLWAAKTASAA